MHNKMKTRTKHKKTGILLTILACLSLIACGGGGGGGGEGGEVGNGENSSMQGTAPERLGVGQTFIATEGSKTYNLPITKIISSGNETVGNVYYDGEDREFRYEKTGYSTATFRWLTDTSESQGISGSGVTSAPAVTRHYHEYTCNFTASNSGQITKVRLVNKSNYGSFPGGAVLPVTGSFKITGKITSNSTTSGSNSSSGNSSSNSSSGSSGSGSSTVVPPSQPSYAPASLNGYYIDWGYNAPNNGIQKIGFEGSNVIIAPDNVQGTYTYTKEDANTGKLKINVPGTKGEFYKTRDYLTLKFTASGKAAISGIIGFHSVSGASVQIKSGKVVITPGSSNSGSSGNSSSTSTTYAPTSMANKSLTFVNNGNSVLVYDFDSSGKVTVTHRFDSTFTKTLSPAGTYTYTKTGEKTAILTATHKYITKVDHTAGKYSVATETFQHKLTFSSSSSGVSTTSGGMNSTFAIKLSD